MRAETRNWLARDLNGIFARFFGNVEYLIRIDGFVQSNRVLLNIIKQFS